MEEAGYQVVSEDSAKAPGAVSIMMEDLYEVASHLGQLPAGPVIRLRDHPDAPTGSPSIYRYDREGLAKALKAAAGGRA